MRWWKRRRDWLARQDSILKSDTVVYQDFDPAKLGGKTILRLEQVQRWRSTCNRLARAFDEVMRSHLQTLTGSSPR
jgi:hypothetical protein